LTQLKSGIYKITCLVNNMIYVGQSKNVKKRLYDHKSHLKNNNSHNKHLQYTWNKYGKDNFIFEVIENCDLHLLDEREEYWIQYYDSYKNGFNQTSGGVGIGINNKVYKYRGYGKDKTKIVVNLNTRERFDNYTELYNKYKVTINDIKIIESGIRKTARGYYWCFDFYGINDEEELKNKKKSKLLSVSLLHTPIKVINITTNEIFNSINEVARQYKINPSLINACINKKQKSTGGYIFMKYEDYINNNKNIDEYYLNNKKLPFKSRKAKIVINVNTKNIYDSIAKASKETGISSGNISECCYHKRKTAGGYQWEFYHEGIDINNINLREPREYLLEKVINLDTNVIYNNATSAEKDLNIFHALIINVCKGKQKKSGGYRWMYYKDYLQLNNIS